MRDLLPEIGLGAAVVLGIIALILGIVTGTHQPWWVQVGIIVAGGAAIEYFGSHLELGAVAYAIPLFAFTLGCVIGDISWAFQTGVVTISAPEFSNPFKVD